MNKKFKHWLLEQKCAPLIKGRILIPHKGVEQDYLGVRYIKDVIPYITRTEK